MDDIENLELLPTLYKFSTEGKLHVWRVGTKDNVNYVETGQVFLANGKEAKLKFSKKMFSTHKAALAKAKLDWEYNQTENKFRPSETTPTCTAHEWNLLHNGSDKKYPAICKQWDDMPANKQVCDNKYPWIVQPYICSIKPDKSTEIIKYDYISPKDDNTQKSIENDNPSKRCTIWYFDGKLKMYDKFCDEIDVTSKSYENLIEQILILFNILNFTMTGNDDVQNSFGFGLDGLLQFPILENSHKDNIHSDSIKTNNTNQPLLGVWFVLFDVMEFGVYNLSGNMTKQALDTEQRFKVIETTKELFESNPSLNLIKLLPSKKICSIDELYKYDQELLEMGYENGLVLRRPFILYPTKYSGEHDDMARLDKIFYEGFEISEIRLIGRSMETKGSADTLSPQLIEFSLHDPIFADKKFTCSCAKELININIDELESYIGRYMIVKFLRKDEMYKLIEPRIFKLEDGNIGNEIID